MNSILVAALAGLGGMLGWGFADFFAKKTIDQIGDVTTLFWGQLIGIVPLVILFFVKPDVPHLTGSQWIWLCVLGVWSGLSYIPTYVAFGKGKVSLLSPIFASYAVVVAILSAVLLKEVVPPARWLAFVIVFVGVIFINGDADTFRSIFGRSRTSERMGVAGLKEILLAICLYSVWLIALDQFINGRYWVPLLLVIRIFSALSLLAYASARHVRLAVRRPGIWKYLVLIGVFDVAAFAAVSFGFSNTNYTSVVAMLSGAFSLPTIILAHLFLKERMTRTQALGAAVSVGGIMLVYALGS